MKSNGLDSGPLAGWVIVPTFGGRLIGKLCENPWRLEPVYELHVGCGMSHDGRFMTQRQVFPLMTFASISSWPMTPTEQLLEVSTLSTQERSHLAGAVSQCEQIIKMMRASEAGISLATDMPKIDPKTLLRKS